MKIGAERKKLILLAVVLVVLAVTVYVQFFSSNQPISARSRPAAVRTSPASEPAQRPPASRASTQQVRGQSFRPKFALGASDQPLDPMTVDPTLRTDLLAKVRAVTFEGVERNLFQFGERKKAAPPPAEDKVAKAQERLKNLPAKKSSTAAPAASEASKAPPIQFKYYGFANGPDDPRKRAFLLDGDEILIGGEGDVVKKRYRIVRIGVNSVVVEDMQFKEEQTLRLEQG